MAALSDHSSRDHALLSASSSARWLVCPPSAVAATLYPETDTAFTREGTKAHEVAESRVRGAEIPVSEDLEITSEMIRCADAYADYIQELITDENAVVLLEQRLDFSSWVPGGFGTGDCSIIQGNRLDVIDYKYGQGVAVTAVGNPQLRLYGLGALSVFGDIYDIQEIVMHIFQPRMNSISVERLSVSELRSWGEDIKPIAALAAEGKGDYYAGTHCRFCPHAGSCPTLAASCAKVANTHGGKAAVPSLAPWMVADILQAEPMISAWLKAVKERALAALLNGEEVPGYKVVEGKLGNRKWTDDAKVWATLSSTGLSPDEFTETKILSPAAMDKTLGKKRVAELLSSLIDRSPGAPTVVPVSDKRKPLVRLAEARKDFE